MAPQENANTDKEEDRAPVAVEAAAEVVTEAPPSPPTSDPDTASAPATIDGYEIPLGEDGKPITADHYNSADAGTWFVNARQQKLYLRCWLPEDPSSIKAVLFYLHGYGAHVSSPSPSKLAEALKAEGIAVFAYDLIGHGRSDGERAFIDDYRHLVDDSCELITLVSTQGCDAPAEKAHFGFTVTEKLSAALKSVPVALSGQSLGGGLALLVGRRISKQEVVAPVRFLGAVLMCPAIKGNPPPAPIVFAMRHLIAPYFPRRLLPDFLERVQVPDLIWTNDIDKVRAKLDRWGEQGGLGWGFNMRLGTGLQLLDMVADIQSNLHEVSFPFTVMHDPDDGVVRFEGTELLLKSAATPDTAHRGKELKPMHGLKHDLLTNASAAVREHTAEWVLDQVRYSRVTATAVTATAAAVAVSNGTGDDSSAAATDSTAANTA